MREGREEPVEQVHGASPGGRPGDDVLPTWTVPPAGVEAALTAHPWGDVSRAWDRRSNGPLRALVAALLRPPAGIGAAAAGAEPFRVWRRYSHAVFTKGVKPLEALVRDLPDQPIDPSTGEERRAPIVPAAPKWDDIGRTVLDVLVSYLPPATDTTGAVHRAQFALFAYFECLVFWEHCTAYDEIEGLIAAWDAHHALLAADAGDGAVDQLAVRTSAAALGAMRTLASQFDVEQAIASCCAASLQRTTDACARRLHDHGIVLRALWSDLTATDGEDPASLGVLRAVAALLLDDLAQTAPYQDLLSTTVTPAARAFLEVIGEEATLRQPALRATVVAQIHEAERRCRSYETSATGDRAVFASELRGHRATLHLAADWLESDAPMLHLDRASATYLYPFALPLTATGKDPIRERLQDYLEGTLTDAEPVPDVADITWTLEDVPQTDSWVDGSGDASDSLGARLRPTSSQLMLRTASGRIFRNLDIEIRVGVLGNHCVRVDLGTHTQRSDDGGRTWSSGHTPWTPHDLDQFVRRADPDGGLECFWFHPSPAELDDLEPLEVPEEPTSLIELVATIVEELDAYAARLHALDNGLDPEDPAAAKASTGYGSGVQEALGGHAQVLITVTEASAIGTTAPKRSIDDPAELLDLVGSGAALTGPRPFPQSILDWIRYPAPTSQSPRLVGRTRGEFVWCTGEVSVVFAPSLPSWQLMETRERLEFGASLTGVHARRLHLLRAKAEDLEHTSKLMSDVAPEDVPHDEPPALESLATKQLQERVRVAATTDIELDELVKSIEDHLDRSRRFRMSSNTQHRDLVRHICERNGVVDLQDSLTASLSSAAAQQRLGRARLERLQGVLAERTREDEADQRRRVERPMQLVLTILGVFAFIDLFWWVNDSWGYDGRTLAWKVEMALLGVAMILAGVVAVRIWRTDEAHDGPLRFSRRREAGSRRTKRPAAPPASTPPSSAP